MKFWVVFTALATMAHTGFAQTEMEKPVKPNKRNNTSLETGFRIDRLSALEKKIAAMEARQ